MNLEKKKQIDLSIFQICLNLLVRFQLGIDSFDSHESNFVFVAELSAEPTRILDFFSLIRTATVSQHSKCCPLMPVINLSNVKQQVFASISIHAYLNIDYFKEIYFKVIFMRSIVSCTKTVCLHRQEFLVQLDIRFLKRLSTNCC